MPNPHNMFNNTAPEVETKPIVNSTTLSIAKVLLYMFVGLLITTAVAFGAGYAVYASYKNVGESALETYLIVLLVSVIALLIDSFVIHFMAAKGKHSILIPGVLYCILMGTTLSFLTLFIPWSLLGITLGITSLAFLLMSLISFLTKGSMNGILVGIIGLAIGVGLLSLFLWIFGLVTGTVLEPLYWAIILGAFVLVMLITIYDLWRVKKIAEQGAMNSNIALYCAFIIYTDFINLFLRILYFVLLIFGRRR